MLISNMVRVQLIETEELYSLGLFRQALDRLNLLLARLEATDGSHCYETAAVLAYTGIALINLGEAESGNLNLKRAVQLIESKGRRIGLARNDLYMGLSETLMAEDRQQEAIYFAELVLVEMSHSVSAMCQDDIVEILRRYAAVVGKVGHFSSAQMIYMLGLIMLQEMNGIESEIAKDALALSAMMPLASYPSTIRNISEKILGTLHASELSAVVGKG